MSVRVDGLPKVLRQLEEVDGKVRRRLVRKGTVAAAKLVQPEVKRLLPRRNGFLQRSIKIKTSAKKGVVSSKIGQEKGRKFKRKRISGSQVNRKGHAAPIWWIERGTKAHTISAPDGRRLVWSEKQGKGKRDALRFARKVRIPATRAQRVLERAERAKKAAMKEVFRETIAAGLREAVGNGN